MPDGTVLSIEVAEGGGGLNSGEPAYLFDPALGGGGGDWVFAGLKPVGNKTAGAVLLSSAPLSLGADPSTFRGDPAVCGANCGKVLVVGGDTDLSNSAQVLASAQLFTPEPPAAAGGGGGTGTGSSSSGLTSSGTTGGGDTVAPGVSAFGLTNNPFVVSGGSTPTFGSAAAKAKKKRHKKGTTFRYTLSEAATVKIVIAQRRSGRRRGKRCVAPTRRLRKAKKCTRITTKGTLTRISKQGANKVAFSGRIGSRKLSPGSYQATLTATDAAKNTSRGRTISFTIVKR